MNKKKHLCALFDLDGVIVDTAKFHFLAWKKIAKNIGYELTHEDNEQLKGVSRQDSLNIILDLANVTIDLEVFNHYLLQKNNDYLLLIQSLSPNDILPGISEALIFLKERRIKIGLGSASKNAKIILQKLQLMDYFEVIIDGNIVIKGKPDPEVFLKGCSALNVPKDRCIVFEDSFAGILAAKEAGMTAVALGDKKFFSNADFCFSDFTQLNIKVLSNLF
jgi:beta-phosphoglucomutase